MNILLTIKSSYILLFLFLIGVASRLPFLEKMQSHWDGPQYTIGVIRYSLEQHIPAPPGYPIYIGLGKLFNIFVPNPHLAILLVSVFFSGIGAIVFYIVGYKLFNKKVGLIASLIFLSGPTFYYFGITANPYGILPITAAILTLLAYEIQKGKNRSAALGIIFALAVGIRPQDALFLTPLFIYGIFISKNHHKLNSILFFIIVFLVWGIPLLESVGGLSKYLLAVNSYKQEALPEFSLSHLTSVWFILIKGAFLSFTIANIFLILFLKDFLKFILIRQKFSFIVKNKYIIIFSLWIFPSLLFNMFVRSDHAGHQMTYLSAVLILLSYAIWRLFRKHQKLLVTVVSIIVVFNLFTFFRDRDPGMTKDYVPQSFHYSEIRKNNIRMRSKVDYIKSNFKSYDTLLITTEPMWRPYSYHLKEYKIIALNALDNKSTPYKYNRYESQDWMFKYSLNHNFSLDIPKEISNIVFIDEDAGKWIKNYHIKKVELAANGSLAIANGKEINKLIYNYHSITFVK